MLGVGQPQDPQPPFSGCVSLQIKAAASQAKGRRDFFFNPAFSLRTERCLEYLFSDFWFNSEAGFVSGTSRVTASFLPSREQALLCCACQGGDQSISCPFSLRTQIFLEAVLLLTEGSRSIHFYHLRSTGGHRSLRRGLRAPARLPQGSHWARA